MREERMPELCGEKSACCGCSACYAVCPVHAIKMTPDGKGFLYPKVAGEICIRCYQCERICPFKKKLNFK